MPRPEIDDRYEVHVDAGLEAVQPGSLHQFQAELAKTKSGCRIRRNAIQGSCPTAHRRRRNRRCYHSGGVRFTMRPTTRQCRFLSVNMPGGAIEVSTSMVARQSGSVIAGRLARSSIVRLPRPLPNPLVFLLAPHRSTDAGTNRPRCSADIRGRPPRCGRCDSKSYREMPAERVTAALSGRFPARRMSIESRSSAAREIARSATRNRLGGTRARRRAGIAAPSGPPPAARGRRRDRSAPRRRPLTSWPACPRSD